MARTPALAPAYPPPAAAKRPPDSGILDQRVQALWPMIQAKYKGRPVARVARELGCDPRDLSLMKYHERRRAAGERVISGAMLDRIERGMGMEGRGEDEGAPRGLRG